MNNKLKIVLLGDNDVGRISIVQCFNKFNTGNPSTEVAVFIYKTIKFPEWNMGWVGQEEFRSVV